MAEGRSSWAPSQAQIRLRVNRWLLIKGSLQIPRHFPPLLSQLHVMSRCLVYYELWQACSKWLA